MLSKIIEGLATASLAISIVQAYLIVAKLWTRKHDRVVAEAQSITSNLLGLFTGAPWVLKFALDGEIKQALVSAVWLLLTVFFTLVALGVWVPSAGQPGLWSRLKAALKLERQEVGELARAFFRPGEAEVVLKILRQVALIDGDLDPRERQFIGEFARTWGLGSPFEGAPPGEGSLVVLRDSVADYLAGRPPRAQATQLREIIAALTQVDGEVAAPEALISREISGMIDGYLETNGARAAHQVVVIPQSDEQDGAIQSLLRGAEKIPFRGGTAYLAGRFYSADYARMMQQKYQTLGFFSVVDAGALAG